MRNGIKRLRHELGSLPRETVVALVVAIIVGVIGPPIVGLHSMTSWTGKIRTVRDTKEER